MWSAAVLLALPWWSGVWSVAVADAVAQLHRRTRLFFLTVRRFRRISLPPQNSPNWPA